MSISLFSRPLAGFVAALSIVTALALALATAAWAGPGYGPDSAHPTIDLAAEVPAGVAIDQGSHVIYVAEASRDLFAIQPGLVEQLNSSGQPTASSPFGTGGQDFFLSVAVDAGTHGVYAYQIEGSTPQGPKGTPKVSAFSSTGALGSSFATANAQAETIAVDSSGRLFFPDSVAHSVQIFSSSGALEGSVTCAACPGGAFVTPQAVAFDSAGKLYVVDSGTGRVLRFSPSGGSYSYESTLQSGRGAVAVAVDGSSNEVFVGDLSGGTYHVVAYDAAGDEFDDFALGAATKSFLEPISGQLAVDATTHEVYLTNPGGGNLRAFERIASIPAPTATIAAASNVEQVGATLRATVNPSGHVLTGCDFEYTDHADFLADEYANAEVVPCSGLVGNAEATMISVSVKGLDPATSYDYRIAVESHGGATASASQSFETLPPLPPEVSTGAATSLTQTTATLGGTVNPKGGTLSSCRFEYVTQASFQSAGFTGAPSKTCTSTPAGNAAAPVSAKLTGLEAGTAYRFRLVATNNSGTAQATDAAFTTAAETCAENAALCPPPPAPPAPSPPAQVEAGPVPASPSGQPHRKPRKRPLRCRKGFKKKRVRGKPRCVRVRKHRHRRH